MLDYDDLDKYIDVVSKRNSFLVDNIIPDFLSLSDLRFVLTSLIREKVSIKDIVYIFEKLNDYAEDSVRTDLVKKLRLALSGKICKQLENADGSLSVFELSDKSMEEIMESFHDGEDAIVEIDAAFAEKIANKLIKSAKQYKVANPIITVPMDFRQIFFGLLSLYVKNVTVIATEEIGIDTKVEVISEI